MTQTEPAGDTATHVASTPLYRVAAGCYVGLIILLGAWLVWLAPPPPGLLSPLLIVFLLPLLLGLRGVLYRRRYTLQWTGMLSLAYFMHGLVAATGPASQRWLGSAEVILTIGYFGAALMVLRRGKIAHKARQKA
ncbi:MAG: DUF2069 domain-containing protein [Spiribacter salinus]|uniref:DUF2069 domain-containing protein n=1 Tax=Spiribacter salinus TaxID=1335746 RepID=A0A540VW19_9GAMM|nr:MAG: DUF2069 domain-containing protein [Spiribacter salinus]